MAPFSTEHREKREEWAAKLDELEIDLDSSRKRAE